MSVLNQKILPSFRMNQLQRWRASTSPELQRGMTHLSRYKQQRTRICQRLPAHSPSPPGLHKLACRLMAGGNQQSFRSAAESHVLYSPFACNQQPMEPSSLPSLTLLHQPAAALGLPPEFHAAGVCAAPQQLVQHLRGLHVCSVGMQVLSSFHLLKLLQRAATGQQQVAAGGGRQRPLLGRSCAQAHLKELLAALESPEVQQVRLASCRERGSDGVPAGR